MNTLKSSATRIAALAMLIAVLLAACGGTDAPTATTVPATATAVPVPTSTVAPPATATVAAPPTATVAPEVAAKILDAQGQTTVHDPSMTKEGDTYYVFMTGRGLPINCSKDLRSWSSCGQVFMTYPDWIATAVPGVRDLWAPDASFHDGKYYVYYAASTFGSNQSAVGLATNVTLDQNSPNYKWTDQGLVIASQKSDNYNAIDPNWSAAKDGQPWLTFGSFWSGIQQIKLDPATNKPPSGVQPATIADNPGSTAIEAPFIIQRGDFYYLFVSHDICCQGVMSSYNIRVGRAKDIAGPYADREGKPMLGGGGTLIYSGSTRWRGPGGQSIYVEGDTYYLVYHSYDADHDGTPTLRIEQLIWDQDNWPTAPSALVGE